MGGFEGDTGSSNNRLLTVLLMVISLVAINQAQSGASGAAGRGNVVPLVSPSGKRRWMIAHGHDWGAQEYFDAKGYIQGFSKDIIEAVCAAGNMDCLTVWAPNTDCWDSRPGEHSTGGQGLLDRWFDACTGWAQTTDRIQVFDFSMAHLGTQKTHMYKKKGSTFNGMDLKGKNIGFVDGWNSDEKCLARAESGSRRNYVLEKTQIFYRASPEVLVPLLRDGTIDVIFTTGDPHAKYFEEIEQIPGSETECMLGGNAMMTRKDNDFIAEWNRAFSKLKSSGGYDKLCQEAAQKHELFGPVRCAN